MAAFSITCPPSDPLALTSILGIAEKMHFSKQLGESVCNPGTAASHEEFASTASS